jgi:hypothetical protein
MAMGGVASTRGALNYTHITVSKQGLSSTSPDSRWPSGFTFSTFGPRKLVKKAAELTGVSEKTVVQVFQYFRDVCSPKLLHIRNLADLV